MESMESMESHGEQWRVIESNGVQWGANTGAMEYLQCHGRAILREVRGNIAHGHGSLECGTKATGCYDSDQRLPVGGVDLRVAAGGGLGVEEAAVVSAVVSEVES